MRKTALYLVLFALVCAVWGTVFILMAQAGSEFDKGLKLPGMILYGFSCGAAFCAYYLLTTFDKK